MIYNVNIYNLPLIPIIYRSFLVQIAAFCEEESGEQRDARTTQVAACRGQESVGDSNPAVSRTSGFFFYFRFSFPKCYRLFFSSNN